MTRAGTVDPAGRTARAPAPRPSAFIIVLRYTAPIARIDALMKEHVAWLRARADDGVFVAWGRQEPRKGGIILARGASRAAIAAVAARDPFVAGGAATARVIEWTPSFIAEGLDALRDA